MRNSMIFILLAMLAVEGLCKSLQSKPNQAFLLKSGSSDKGSGSNGEESESSDSDLDWLDVILDQCKINLKDPEQLEMPKPVSAAEMNGAINDVSTYMNSALGTLQSHKPLVDQVVSELADSSLADLFQHKDVFSEFSDAVLAATTGGICHFLKLFMLVERLAIAGAGPGFSREGNCDESMRLLTKLYAENNDDYGKIIESLSQNITSLRVISGAVASDMSCIIDDITAFEDFVFLMNATTGSNVTLRQVMIGVSGIEAWGGIVVKQIYTYYFAVEHLNLLLVHADTKVDEATTPAPTTAPSAKDFKLQLKRLKALLNKVDEW